MVEDKKMHIRQDGTEIAKGLVVAVQRLEQSDRDRASSLEEMSRLAATLGIEVVERVVQKRRTPSTATYAGSGKLEEIATIVEEKAIDTVLVDDELRPRQHDSMEKALGVSVRDRADVILEIFERQAGTKQAQMEVEIARLRYELPRLREDEVYEGRRGGGGRGERGHTNVELGKQRIRDRIADLKESLAQIQEVEESRRKQRENVYRVSLVGYTNAGKSTLMDGLCEMGEGAEDKLFATLGTTVRRLDPPTTPSVVVTDTVGFIRDLPHELVASFRATLAEAAESDLIVVVVDGSDSNWRQKLQVTEQTLDSIGASSVPRKVVFNKMDRLDSEGLPDGAGKYEEALALSALDENEVARLREAILDSRDRQLCEETVLIPFDQGSLVGEVYDRASVVDERHTEEGTVLEVRARRGDLERWRKELGGSTSN